MTARSLNAQCNCIAFHSPSFQLCRSTGQQRQNWFDLVAYASETIGVTMYGGSHVVDFFKHAMMRLQFAHVRCFACRGRLRNLLADCSTVGLCCVTITRQKILKLSPLLKDTIAGVLSIWPGLPLRGFSTQIYVFKSTWVSRFNYEKSR